MLRGSEPFHFAVRKRYNLAIAYREGLGITKDLPKPGHIPCWAPVELRKAFYWCRKAAEQGDHDKV